MNRPFAASVLLLLALPAAAQNDDADLDKRQAKTLNAFAKKAFDKGFPRQAKLIWLQVLKLYDSEDAEAHKGLGHVKTGSSWNPDPKSPYPTADTGTGADGASLFSQYEQMKKTLAQGHRAQAEKWEKAGNTPRARHHWEMVLRWVASDDKAKKALEHRDFGGVSGSAIEQTLYENSKKIEQAVVDQSRTDYPVQKTADHRNEILDKAQVKYITLTSEHFVLHGDAEEEATLAESLRWAERTLRVCEVAFPWKPPFVDQGKWPNEWAFFVAKETYQQILQAHKDKVQDLEWKLKHTTTSGIGNTALAATSGKQVSFDAAVRNVARAWAGFGTDGLNEGIGHTFVGMIFNNNRLFSVDLKKQQGTAASEEDREYQSPDFDVWKNLNLELAWKATGGVPARDLPFCDAAAFTNEQRIKAWSFSDYVMRRDPNLLLAMDRLGLEMQAAKQKQPLEFEARFDAAHDVKLDQLEKEWVAFWTEASPVLKAIQNNTPPLAAVSKGVEKWLEAFNLARKEANRTPVTWSSNLSTRCHDHAEYLARNKQERGPIAEHQQKVELGGSYVGSMFAETAIVEIGAKPANAKKMFARWLEIPGYRDAIVNSFLVSVGIYSDNDILVMNVVSGIGQPTSRGAGYGSYPLDNQENVPVEVAVADIGPELVALLEKHGKAGKKTVGFPLTLHFGSVIGGNRHTYSCAVQDARGNDVPGAILLDDGHIRRSSAPGMVTFYPFDPLPRGEVTAHWSWNSEGGPQKLAVKFKTR
ncbi:MAG: hypothetical protein IPK26_26160 [Planctomycetes bacterium]|nr:hypothetical protein [Planctomycetota bacterium]